ARRSTLADRADDSASDRCVGVHGMKFRVVIACLAFIFFAAAGFFVWQTIRWIHTPIETLTNAAIYEVPQGATLNTVLFDLQKHNLIDHPRRLSIALRALRSGYKLKAGEYELQARMTPLDVVDLLSSGRVVLHKLTVPEGVTFAELQRLRAANDAIRISSPPLNAATLLKRLGAKQNHPEGLFFPDTYNFPKGTPDTGIYTLAYQRMQSELERAWNERDANLPLKTPYEVLTLASIVEKETALGSERPIIAGVFIERLRKGMRLETDPTVIYGLGDAYDGHIHTADLHRDTPYNTRLHVGLTPTPICLPGLDSVRAVVHPNITGALFFVATGNSDGSHHFSKTLEEHNAAVQRYLKTLRKS
ncbi:MAG TPA: endolytic transglycosylase MltG, partial [Steroidobacteraceae bacterium]|nr:endolytic transglycosylase MltG [Steroidobacteraceae bacterium]